MRFIPVVSSFGVRFRRLRSSNSRPKAPAALRPQAPPGIDQLAPRQQDPELFEDVGFRVLFLLALNSSGHRHPEHCPNLSCCEEALAATAGVHSSLAVSMYADGWLAGWLAGWMDGWFRVWGLGLKVEGLGFRVDGWMDGWMGGRLDR